MSDDPSYVSYVKFAQSVGSPVLSYEDWAGIRRRLDRGEAEADRIREKWLAEECDVRMRPPTRTNTKSARE